MKTIEYEISALEAKSFVETKAAVLEALKADDPRENSTARSFELTAIFAPSLKHILPSCNLEDFHNIFANRNVSVERLAEMFAFVEQDKKVFKNKAFIAKRTRDQINQKIAFISKILDKAEKETGQPNQILNMDDFNDPIHRFQVWLRNPADSQDRTEFRLVNSQRMLRINSKYSRGSSAVYYLTSDLNDQIQKIIRRYLGVVVAKIILDLQNNICLDDNFLVELESEGFSDIFEERFDDAINQLDEIAIQTAWQSRLSQKKRPVELDILQALSFFMFEILALKGSRQLENSVDCFTGQLEYKE
jgi:hypothetical protein